MTGLLWVLLVGTLALAGGAAGALLAHSRIRRRAAPTPRRQREPLLVPRGGYPAGQVSRIVMPKAPSGPAPGAIQARSIEIPAVPDEPAGTPQPGDALPCGCRPADHAEALHRLAAAMRDRPHSQ